MKLIAATCLFSFSCFFPCMADWPEALLPPGVRTESGPPAGMCFPVLLGEMKLSMGKTVTADQLPLPALAFNSEATHLAAWLPDGHLRLQDIYKNKTVWETPVSGRIRNLVFSADGKMLWGLGDEALVYFDSATGKQVKTLAPQTSLLKHSGGVFPLGEKQVVLLSSGHPDAPLLQIIDCDGKLHPPVPQPAGRTVLASDVANGQFFFLTQSLEHESNGNTSYQIMVCNPGEESLSPLHAFTGNRSPTGQLAVSPDAKIAGVAIPGTTPFTLPLLAPKPLKPVPLLVSNSRFSGVFADSAKAILFSGAIVDGKSPPAKVPFTDLVAFDTETGQKWRLSGEFIPGAVCSSHDGRWVAVLANTLPVRGPRGRGLVLLDNRRRGKGDQRIAYTFSTQAAPLPPLVMAADGSAMAFPEWRGTNKQNELPSLVINIIR